MLLRIKKRSKLTKFRPKVRLKGTGSCKTLKNSTFFEKFAKIKAKSEA